MTKRIMVVIINLNFKYGIESSIFTFRTDNHTSKNPFVKLAASISTLRYKLRSSIFELQHTNNPHFW